MAFFGFGKKKTEPAADAAGDGNGKGGTAVSSGFQSDARKAKAWFDRAHQVADTNHEYAIDSFVSGLKFQPDAMREHEALREVGMRRKANGGKPAGMKDTMSSGGKTAVEKMAHAEKLWAMDPMNVSRALAVMEKAAQIHETEETLDLGEVVVWIGERVMELNSGPKASKATFVRAMELFESVRAYKEAEEACRRALQVDNDDGMLISKLKDLAALKTIDAAGMTGKEGDSRKGVKDMNRQQELEEADRTNLDESGHERVIQRARAALAAKPDDVDLQLKLVKALLNRNDDDADEEAIKVLRNAYETTGQYRFKFDVGDVTMRQLNRQHRMLRDALAANPGDAALTKDLENHRKKQLEFELAEYTERVAQYPTIMKLRYELGKRLMQAKKYEDAVAAFQDAKADPKIRVQSMEALGICYLQMEWLEPAVDTLDEAMKRHEIPGDDLDKSLKYLSIDALERYAKKFNSLEHARRAQTLASTLLQMDIRYRKIRERVNELRDLVAEMSKGQTA